jgi:hypothetical protein
MATPDMRKKLDLLQEEDEKVATQIANDAGTTVTAVSKAANMKLVEIKDFNKLTTEEEKEKQAGSVAKKYRTNKKAILAVIAFASTPKTSSQDEALDELATKLGTDQEREQELAFRKMFKQGKDLLEEGRKKRLAGLVGWQSLYGAVEGHWNKLLSTISVPKVDAEKRIAKSKKDAEKAEAGAKKTPAATTEAKRDNEKTA